MNSSYAFCHLSVVPMRAEPAHKAEMTNQLLFGEMAEIKDVKGDWLYVVAAHDNYIGWVHNKQLVELSVETLQKLLSLKPLHTTEIVQLVYNHLQKKYLPLLIGSTIP